MRDRDRQKGRWSGRSVCERASSAACVQAVKHTRTAALAGDDAGGLGLADRRPALMARLLHVLRLASFARQHPRMQDTSGGYMQYKSLTLQPGEEQTGGQPLTLIGNNNNNNNSTASSDTVSCSQSSILALVSRR
jgi:hypothetical protein